MAAAGKIRGAARHRSNRGAGSGGHDTGKSTASLRVTLNGASFWHAHIPDCQPVCILERESVWSWDPRAFALAHRRAQSIANVSNANLPDLDLPRATANPNVAPSEPPDPDP